MTKLFLRRHHTAIKYHSIIIRWYVNCIDIASVDEWWISWSNTMNTGTNEFKWYPTRIVIKTADFKNRWEKNPELNPNRYISQHIRVSLTRTRMKQNYISVDNDNYPERKVKIRIMKLLVSSHILCLKTSNYNFEHQFHFLVQGCK